MGWGISQPLSERRDRILVTVAAIAPDIDGVTLFGGVDLYHEYHHTFGHNIFLAVIFAIACVPTSREKKKIFLLALLSFHSHLIADLLGSGADWGIFYLWPFSRYEITSFPPFQWELHSWQNIVTTILLILGMYVFSLKKGRTIAEVFSLRLDAEVVKTFRKWAGKDSARPS